MRRRWIGGLVIMAFAVSCADPGPAPTEIETLVVPVFTHAPGHQAKNFRTHLSGAEEVPANTSTAQGQAIFQLQSDGTLTYKLIVANIEDIRQAHIHRAPAGSNGGIVAWLFPDGPPATLVPGRTDGVLAEGAITDARVIGSLAGQGVAGLLAMMRAGNTYVNVHTVALPGGEVRGQIH